MGSLVEFAHKLWAIGVFIPVFCCILLVGFLKALLTGPCALAVVFFGNVAVLIGLLPAFVFWTYRSVIETKKFGFSLKLLSIICLPIPLIIWPLLITFGSFLVGVGYGFFAPVIATFEAAGEEESRLFYYLTAGTWGTLKGSCTIVRDFYDWCYHSYPAYMDDFRNAIPEDGEPYTIRFLEVPQCLLVGALGMLVDVPAITAIAALKSPIMLVKGWKKSFDDFEDQNGACTKAVCVPITGISIILWPLAVVTGFVIILLGSFLAGLFGGVVVYQEGSFFCGLAYIVAVISEFDEYSNDILYLREGSCLPRPRYRKNTVVNVETSPARDTDGKENMQRISSINKLGTMSNGSRHGSGKFSGQLTVSRSVRQTIQQVQMVQIWDHLFKSLQLHGKVLFQAGIIKTSDLEDYLCSVKSERKKMVELGLLTYTLLKNLMISAKTDSIGLVLSDGLEVTSSNRPQDRLMEWLFDPMVVLKQQIRAASLQAPEEHYLEKVALSCGHPEQLDFWQNGSVEPENEVKKGELQALARRMQGLVTTASRFPTFRRRFQQFIKSLLASAAACQAGEGTSRTEGEVAENTSGMQSGDDAV